MPWLNGLKRVFRRSRPDSSEPDGWAVAGLTAYYGSQFPSKPAAIKYISAGGIYLDIQDPPTAGEPVALALKMECAPEPNPELEVMIPAEFGSEDEFGVKLSFVLPPSLDTALWEVLIRGIAVIGDPVKVVQVFRTLRAVLFLCRICPSGADEALHLLSGHLEEQRSETLFKIAFTAENLLVADPEFDAMRAHPRLVAAILRDGSWSADELITQLWIGLLVSSCSLDEPDEGNQIFADMLVQMTPRQAKIFTYACECALEAATQTGDLGPASIVLDAEEIVQLTGMHDLTRNATDLAYLYNLGLIENVFDFTSYRDFDHFDITPSRLGLELHWHCHGRRSKMDAQLTASAKKHLAVFIPSPQPSAFQDFSPMAPVPLQDK